MGRYVVGCAYIVGQCLSACACVRVSVYKCLCVCVSVCDLERCNFEVVMN